MVLCFSHEDNVLGLDVPGGVPEGDCPKTVLSEDLLSEDGVARRQMKDLKSRPEPELSKPKF